MPSIGVKLYSVFFKLVLRHRMLNPGVASSNDGHGVTSRANSSAAANASFVDGVATKDIHIDPFTSLSLRIFLPQTVLPRDQIAQVTAADVLGFVRGHETQIEREWQTEANKEQNHRREGVQRDGIDRKSSGDWGPDRTGNDSNTQPGYHGYLPANSVRNHKRLPIVVQFHGGGFVIGSKDSPSNDLFCKRMAKLCNAIVIAVGYRLAPEHKYPAAFDDGYEALKWLAKQANLAQCNKSLEHVPQGYAYRGNGMYRELVDSFGDNAVEPWLSAHGDPSRCILLGVSNGSNIADHVARRFVTGGSSLEPVKIVGQALMYPFFYGQVPTRSEIKLANSYFFDKASCLLAWKLFLPDNSMEGDHPAANPLIINEFSHKLMPPTLTVVAELDWMKDRAIAYSEALRKAHVEATVVEYKDAVHEFATLDILVNTRQAEACAEEIAIWIKKHASAKGSELSY